MPFICSSASLLTEKSSEPRVDILVAGWNKILFQPCFASKTICLKTFPIVQPNFEKNIAENIERSWACLSMALPRRKSQGFPPLLRSLTMRQKRGAGFFLFSC